MGERKWSMVLLIFAAWAVLPRALPAAPLFPDEPAGSGPPEACGYGPDESTLYFALVPGTDDTLLSQPFVYGDVWNAWPCESGSDLMLAEDCYPVSDFQIGDVQVWMIYGSGTPVTQFNLGLQHDSNGPDGQFIWLSGETDISSTPTGYSGWGYEFWHSHIAISDSPVLCAGSEYWFCLQAVSNTGVYWLFTYNPPGWGEQAMESDDNGLSWSIPSWDFGTFIVIGGTNTALERRSWGGIKVVCR